MSDPEHKDVSSPVRRLEIFTGAGRRRRWPAAVKAGIVAESYRSGETVCGVARRHGLTAQQLFAWRRQARRAEARSRAPLGFAPVVVTSTASAPASTGAVPGIEIVVADVVIRVPANVDGETLARVLRAVRAP